MPKTKSGKYWVDWANTHAKNSESVDDLADPFKANAKAFIKALEDAGAKVKVSATKRDAKRAYLFHWSLNTKLHVVGESYGVKKLKTDAPHWSSDGF